MNPTTELLELTQDWGNRCWESTNRTLWAPEPKRKQQKPHKRLIQTCLCVSRSLRRRRGSAVSCQRVGGTGQPFEGGHYYLHYLHHSLASGQTTGKEHSPSTENWIKDLWSMALPIRPRPSFPLSQFLPSESFHEPLQFSGSVVSDSLRPRGLQHARPPSPTLKVVLKVGGEGDDRGWDGWMSSQTQWTRDWVNSGSWWWTGRPGVLLSMGSQRARHNWVTELNIYTYSFLTISDVKNLFTYLLVICLLQKNVYSVPLSNFNQIAWLSSTELYDFFMYFDIHPYQIYNLLIFPHKCFINFMNAHRLFSLHSKWARASF